MTPRRILFSCLDPAWLDLDWILPVVDDFAANGYRCEILLLNPPTNAFQRFLLGLAREVAHDVLIGLDRFEPLPAAAVTTLRRASERGGIGGRAARAYFAVGGRWMRRLRLDGWRVRALEKALSAWMKGAGLVFLPNQRNDGAFAGPPRLLNTSARAAGCPIVSYPAAISAFDVPWDKLRPTDFMLTVAPHQEAAFVENGVAGAAVGAPKFAPAWRKRVQDAWHAFGGIDLPPDRTPILVVLKNDTSILWRGNDFERGTRALIDGLRGPDRLLVLKPHPRQTMARLNAALADVPKDQYIIDFGPLSYWAAKVDIVVSQFSGGAVDALAEGNVPFIYWPVDETYARAIDEGRVPEVYVYRNDQGGFDNQFKDFSVVIAHPQEVFQTVDPAPYRARFDAMFRPDYGGAGVRALCESHFLAIHAD